MKREEAVKKVWDFVTSDKIKEAEELARQFDIEMSFDEGYISVEDDVFYI